VWNVVVERGATVDLGAVPVVAPVTFEAVFEAAPTGAELQIGLTSLEPPPHAALRARTGRYGSVKTGTFSAQVAPGRYRVRASAPGVLAVAETDTRKLAGEPLRVPMQATGKLRVTPPEEPAQLAVRDAAGTPLFRRWLTWSTPFDVELLPGSYTIEVTPFGGAPATRTLEIGAAGAALDLRAR
jgi:hypothetical protein